VIKKLLKNNDVDDAFKNKLDISDGVEQFMLDCRQTIREKLRNDFKRIGETREECKTEEQKLLRGLTPRFFTQGSYAYKTQNMPCYQSQEIDLDDGVYFPMTFVEGNPKANKIELVSLVRASLTELAEQTGWKLSGKAMCFRLQVESQIHVDVPIYAIPDIQYAALTEARNRALIFVEDQSIVKHQRLNPNHVYIALLDDDAPWHKSDPKQLHEWFVSQTKRYPHLRNICRYLKAWRDNEWVTQGPSSIMLMVASANALNDFPKTPESECEAMLVVAKALPDIFNSDINNPVDVNENMFPSRCKSDHEAEDIRKRIAVFGQAYADAVCTANSKQKAVDSLIRTFGARMPDREDWVKDKATPASIRKAPVVTAAAITPTAAKSHISA
jgi:hypothetical protein